MKKTNNNGDDLTAISTSYVIENDRQFRKAIREATNRVADLRFAFGEIARDWFKSNRTQFTLKGSGLYPPLSPAYAEQKAKKFPGAAILVRTGRLRDSVTKKGHPDNILQIGKQTLVMGTRTPYGIFHQSDAPRRNLPLRKFLFIGPEAPQHARGADAGRLERWTSIIEKEVQRQLDKVNG